MIGIVMFEKLVSAKIQMRINLQRNLVRPQKIRICVKVTMSYEKQVCDIALRIQSFGKLAGTG